MATTYQLKTFSDLYSAVLEELKVQASDTVALNRIKRAINMAYINEVVPYDQWKWLRGSINLVHDAAITTGTCTVTQNSATVTLTTAPANSVRGYYFSPNSSSTLYKVAKHTAGSTTVYLDCVYIGETDSEANYKIWTDAVPLPADCREVLKVTHAHQNVPLQAEGLQRFREIVASGPKLENRPSYSSTSDFVDPNPYSAVSDLPALTSRASNGLVRTLVFASTVASLLDAGDRIEISLAGANAYNGQFIVSSVSTTTITYTATSPYAESATADLTLTLQKLSVENNDERYRELLVYPSIFNAKTVLHVDYLKEALPLTEDDDEPLLPIEDRIVLFYAACQWGWSTIGRNSEEAARNQALYNNRLLRMVGKMDDSVDMPRLSPSKTYLGSKRQTQRQRDPRYTGGWGSGGGSSNPTTVRGTANTVATFDANGELTGLATVDTTEIGFVDGLASPAVGTTQAQTLTNKTMSGASNTLSNIPYASLILTGAIVNADVSASAAIAYSKLNLALSIVNADVSTSAAIAYSKLNLAGSIVNADVHATAAITVSKLAALTASRAAATDASGFLSAATTTLTQLNLLSIATGSTGTGNLVFSISPTLTGTTSAAALTLSGLFTASNGTEANPSITFSSANTTGFFRNGTGIGLSAGGAVKAYFTSTGHDILSSSSAKLRLLGGMADSSGIEIFAGATRTINSSSTFPLVLQTNGTNGVHISSAQLVTIGAAGGTQTHVLNGSLSMPAGTLSVTHTSGDTLTLQKTGSTPSILMKNGTAAQNVYIENDAGVVKIWDNTHGTAYTTFNAQTGVANFYGLAHFNANATLQNQGELRFHEGSSGANYVGFKAPASLSADKVWTLPSADGSADQVLKTNGSGVLDWATVATTSNVVETTGAANLRMLRARMNGGTGVLSESEGFAGTSARLGTGQYRFDFTTAFSDTPVAVATSIENAYTRIAAQNTTAVQVYVYDAAGNLIDGTVNVIVIGPD